MKPICPICYSKNVHLFFKGSKQENYREYYHCDICDVVFVDPKYYLSLEDEKKRYLLHNNNMDDSNYRKFLTKMFDSISPFLKPNTKGLDYGCGPCTLLCKIFEEHGFKMDHYDPFFFDNKDIFNKTYDFVVSTEAVEHFYKPKLEFEKIFSLINNKGHVGIMTNIPDSWDEFSNWYYRLDLTHVMFYSKKTFEWLAKKFAINTVNFKKNIVIFSL